MTKSAKVYDYDTKQLKLFGGARNRIASNAKDQLFYNGMFDVWQDPIEKQTYTRFFKRGGFNANTTVIGGGGAARGIYYWTRTGKTYSVVANKLYSNTTSIQTLTTSTGKVWFEEATGSSDVMIVCDGTKTYTVSLADSVTEIVDADFPAGFITPVSLDGYVFGVKSGTDEIWNSDVDAPTAWTATSFVSAEMYPDNLVALAKQANYIVAFGTYSTEFLYDNENATGSPLRRTDSVAAKIGLAARDSVAQLDKRLIFVGQTRAGDPGVWIFDSLTPTQISDEFVDRLLENEGSSLANATGYTIKHKGHNLYVLNLTSRSIVYDMDMKVWIGDWSIYSSGNHAVLPFKYMTEGANNTILVLHNTDGKIYKLDQTLFQDDAGAILCWLVTDKQDLENQHFKRIFATTLVCSRQSAGTCTIEWTDDDYQSWSNARTLDLTTRPYTKACGISRRRAWRIKHSANYDFDAEMIELDYNDGIH